MIIVEVINGQELLGGLFSLLEVFARKCRGLASALPPPNSGAMATPLRSTGGHRRVNAVYRHRRHYRHHQSREPQAYKERESYIRVIFASDSVSVSVGLPVVRTGHGLNS